MARKMKTFDELLALYKKACRGPITDEEDKEISNAYDNVEFRNFIFRNYTENNGNCTACKDCVYK
jgi:hypothetical protein